MSDPVVAVVMLGIFVLTILLGFPICFTLMAMGVAFGFYAYYDAERMSSIFDNQIFDLLVNQTYSVMANDVLTAVPLFLFMGYIVERANIVDRLFFSLQIAARRMPGSMAIAALATCALFATATGIIGAVVTLMGLLAFPAMLKARYDTSFSAGVICAGGCLGILIPPSIMLIVYAATSNVSVVRLYAGAIFPGFMLAGLYIVYVIGRAMLNPKLAPKPRAEDIGDLSIGQVTAMMLTSFFPLAFLILSVLGAILFGLATPSEAASMGALGGLVLAACYRLGAIFRGDVEPPAWASRRLDHGAFALLPALALGGLLSLSTLAVTAYVGLFFGYAADIKGWSGGLWLGLGVAYALLVHFARPLVAGVFSALMEPGPVRSVLLGVCAVSGAIAFALLLYDAFTWMSADPDAVRPAEEGEGGSGGSLRTWTGFVCGLVLLVYTLGAFFYWMVPRLAEDRAERRFLALLGGAAAAGAGLALAYMLVVAPLFGKETSLRALDAGFLALLLIAATVLGTHWDRLKESVYLTVRTAAMVCWLFVGSWTFSSVFSYLGGHELIQDFVLGLGLSALTFLIMAQLIIFLLGWPLEWSEIIIIFVPIFLPMLEPFGIDPLFFGILVALNLQTSFLTPPMAMAAYYLKGVAPPHIQLVEIFKGVLPFLSMVILAMVLLYLFPQIALWLPEQIYR